MGCVCSTIALHIYFGSHGVPLQINSYLSRRHRQIVILVLGETLLH